MLSFSPITTRSTAVSFLGELIRALPSQHRDKLASLLLSVFHAALDTRHGTGHRDYEPINVSAPARHAAYAANLLVLAVLAAGEVSGEQLFPGSDDPILDWRAMTVLWRSQLSGEGWSGMVLTLAVDRKWHGHRRYVTCPRAIAPKGQCVLAAEFALH
jgi:hypothetical protein